MQIFYRLNSAILEYAEVIMLKVMNLFALL